MNIGINNNVNCNRPAFGMSVLLEKSADKLIKQQTMGMSQKSYDKFWKIFDGVVGRQEGTLPNIILRKAKYRNALVAEVVDPKTDTAVKSYVTAQGLIHRKGSLNFLKRAETRADKLRDANERLENYNRPEKIDYHAGNNTQEESVVEL